MNSQFTKGQNLAGHVEESPEIPFFQIEDGRRRIEVSIVEETIRLSLTQMADLCNRNKPTIFRHCRNVFQENELRQEVAVAIFATVQPKGNRNVCRDSDHFNLDGIIDQLSPVNTHFEGVVGKRKQLAKVMKGERE